MKTPSRVIASRRRSGLLMALAAVCFLGALLGVEQRDDSWLLTVAGRPVDAVGRAASAWAHVARVSGSCSAMKQLPPGDPVHEQSAAALRAYSPPDSQSAQVLSVQALGPWRLVQATFETLEPVVVVVREEQAEGTNGPHATVWPQGVWSGTTHPWNAGWRIRGFISSRAPEVPQALLDCLEPADLFNRPGGLTKEAVARRTTRRSRILRV